MVSVDDAETNIERVIQDLEGLLEETDEKPIMAGVRSEPVPAVDPAARRQRIMLDPGAFDKTAPLREVGPGHLAAVR